MTTPKSAAKTPEIAVVKSTAFFFKFDILFLLGHRVSQFWLQ